MTISREQLRVLSAVIAGLAFLLARSPLGLAVILASVLILLFPLGLWRPVPTRALRSMAILTLLLIIPYLALANAKGALLAAGRVVGLFALSLLVLRGIGSPSLLRTLREFATPLGLPFQGAQDLLLTPHLLNRFNYEWKKTKVLVLCRMGGQRKVAHRLYRLRTLFWHSQTWPCDLQVAQAFRTGTGEQKTEAKDSKSIWRETVLLLGAIALLTVAMIGI